MKSPLFVAIVLVATSLGVVFPVLKDSHTIDSSLGQLIIAAASIYATARSCMSGAYVPQLTRLGVPTLLAGAVAADVDWHQVAALVHCGCSPRLALRIVQ